MIAVLGSIANSLIQVVFYALIALAGIICGRKFHDYRASKKKSD